MVLSTAKEKISAVSMKRQIAKNVVMPAISTIRLSWKTAHVPTIKRPQKRAIESRVVSIGLAILRVRFDSSPVGY